MKICHACNRDLDLKTAIGRRDVCPFCRADLHCCLSCAFYEPRTSRECREPVAVPVKDKQKANFCDYFRIRNTAAAATGETAADKARKQLDDLFKQ